MTFEEIINRHFYVIIDSERYPGKEVVYDLSTGHEYVVNIGFTEAFKNLLELTKEIESDGQTDK